MKRLLSLSALTFAALALPLLAAGKKKASPAPAPAEPQAAAASAAGTAGWLNWRGPDQNGTSPETGLPDKVDAKAALWTADLPGQSAPVIANGKLYITGYMGEGPELQEVIACFDAETGKKEWDYKFNDFLSDTIYLRYATSSPTIDPETGNVYMLGTQGIFACFTADGKELWEHSMMEEFGRMTFPNSRTASPVVDGELVITRGITANWGASGAPGDRFYAFDKKTGEIVWTSAPADKPQDNTFSNPLMTWVDGKRTLISAAGDSSVVGLNARTGEPMFHFFAAKAGAKGGINASIVQYKDELLVIHESENLDTSEVGRSAAYKIPHDVKPGEPGKLPEVDSKTLELWRNPAGNLASSPCLVGNRMYEVTGVGEVVAIDADNGKTLWKKKLAAEQRQSSPFFADGKLYVAIYIAGQGGGENAQEGAQGGGNGELFVIKPTDKDGEIVSRTVLDGRCYGSPIAYNGKLYLQTTRKIYCFGKAGANPGLPKPVAEKAWPKAGPAAKLQIIPNEVYMRPGQALPLRIRALDANGFTAEENVDPKSVKMEQYIPPTALVKATMKGKFEDGKLVADADVAPSAGAFMATKGELKGIMRGRILPHMPFKQDFESFDLPVKTGPGPGGEVPPELAKLPPGPTNANTLEPVTAFNYPPLAWNAARFKFEIRKAPGEGENKALCKTIDNKRLQRGQVFIGHPESKNYTVEADVMTEGNKRKMSEVGLINQRYLINLKGNAQQIEVTSNQELLRASIPFKWSPNEWYHMKTRVDIAADGSGIIRAKVWKKTDPEPEKWNVELNHKTANTNGCPGFFAFAPQEQRAWIDNLTVTPNEDAPAKTAGK